MQVPSGFLLSAINSGIKEKKLDLGLIFCKDFAKAVGFFTTNKNPSYSVIVSKQNIKYPIKAVLVNSGNANCFWGKNGVDKTKQLCEDLAKLLGVKLKNILIASTGIIGKPLAVEKIKNNLASLVKNLSDTKIEEFATSIMTTDTIKKIAYQQINFSGKIINILGFAKGAGMIYPNMATMLAFVLTDAKIDYKIFRKICRDALNLSFNSITVDACTSTNDTFLVLSSQKIPVENTDEIKVFSEKLKQISLDLAKMIIKDAEGATKFIEITVTGASSQQEAKKAAFSIANSNLFKCAIYGANPNWGRIIAALGQVGIKLNEDKLKINSTDLKKPEIKINVDLSKGNSSFTVYTCDLTEGYIKINAEYS